MSKYLQISDLLERRIEHGDYLTREFPTDRDLALELAVNPRTVRKAVQRLISSGLLVRAAGGRPRVERGARGVRSLRIAFLAVAYPSPHIEQWHQAIDVAALRGGHLVRMVGYSHVNDPVILDTIENFDATFVMAAGEVLGDGALRRIAATARPVVFINQDVSRFGMPSLWLASPVHVQKLFEHLGDLGHRSIDCLNMQPEGDVIDGRIGQWQLWSRMNGGAGELVNRPVAPFGSVRVQAYETMKARLANGHYLSGGGSGEGSSAIFATTFDAAVGAIRALHEAGLTVGRDVSVCSADDAGGLAPYLTPSVTSLRDADPVPYVAACVDWMADRATHAGEGKGGDWPGPLIVQPAAVPVFAGESTGLAVHPNRTKRAATETTKAE